MTGRLVGVVSAAGAWLLVTLLSTGVTLADPAAVPLPEPPVLRAGPLSIDVSTGLRARMMPLVLADLEIFTRRHYPEQSHPRELVEGLRRFRAPGERGRPAVEVAAEVDRVSWLELAALQDLLELHLDSRR
jgi:hypothetical protein